MTTTEIENCAALRAYLAADVGDPVAIEKYNHPDIVLPAHVPGGKQGIEGLKALYAMYNASIRIQSTVQDMFAEGDKVVARLLIRGQQTGDFMGIPNQGRTFSIEEIMIAEFRAGKIIQVWRVADLLSLVQQLKAPERSAV